MSTVFKNRSSNKLAGSSSAGSCSRCSLCHVSQKFHLRIKHNVDCPTNKVAELSVSWCFFTTINLDCLISISHLNTFSNCDSVNSICRHLCVFKTFENSECCPSIKWFDAKALGYGKLNHALRWYHASTDLFLQVRWNSPWGTLLLAETAPRSHVLNVCYVGDHLVNLHKQVELCCDSKFSVNLKLQKRRLHLNYAVSINFPQHILLNLH